MELSSRPTRPDKIWIKTDCKKAFNENNPVSIFRLQQYNYSYILYKLYESLYSTVGDQYPALPLTYRPSSSALSAAWSSWLEHNTPSIHLSLSPIQQVSISFYYYSEIQISHPWNVGQIFCLYFLLWGTKDLSLVWDIVLRRSPARPG